MLKNIVPESAFSATTRNVRISVQPAPLEQHSDPHNQKFAFAYTITIENLGTEVVQLLERHWIILSGGVQIAEVVGPGVVGVQPVLKPGHAHRYTSGAEIQDPVGAMYGSYTFKNQNDEYFQVKIPKFELIYPIMVH